MLVKQTEEIMEDYEFRNLEPPKIWDNTMRSMLVQCPRKLYYFLRRFDYAPAEMPAYFSFGRAFHQGLLTWHTTADDPVKPYARQLVALAAAKNLWDNEAAIAKPPTDCKENLLAKLESYFDFWGTTEVWKFVPLGGEAGWIWPLGTTGFELAGAIDGYVNWPERGMFVLEHKTTGGYITEGYRAQWHFATQITGYVWYLHQILPKEEIFGAMINMITKNRKTERSRWKTPEFDRELVKKTKQDIEIFAEDFYYDLQQFQRYWNDWHWPQTGRTFAANCTGGPGRSPCLFRAICATPIRPEEVNIKRYPHIIEKAEAWEPWKRTEEEGS